ncbi:type II toxin-antitoxin system death-on-curing family toxin [Enterococcus alishanensis]|uniref:Type II toxin-antitoxin system death-on-curing family toxin n=1 Tax=Enterococcus alishanensis TaxID=1303817 RepID=A0ABS6TC04_9ENTE|nr:type II toxin-antitoxin system death-on-curing family toxin [Enterococcus alishanensis]MBV7390420.1 type II toxin-antitoxin system death-on-curing family toxin [Enterococcus alishanensis]
MIYLSSEAIVRINARVITNYSPGEMIGLKDAKALAMIVNLPQQVVFGQELYQTIFDKAAILVINLIKRHPFHNGNKRTALVAMVTFLKINDYRVDLDQAEAVAFILKITTSQLAFDELKAEVVEKLAEIAGSID